MRSGLRDTGVMLLGAGVGAGLMFLLDPRGGAYRRSLVRDKFVSLGKQTAWEADKRRRDVMNRMRGEFEEFRRRGQVVDDDTLVERARAQIGHAVSHPGSLEISAVDGCVYVRGPVLRGEAAKLEQRLRKTRGVQRSDLSGVVEHDSAENIPGLQGESRQQRRAV
ncbi:MAG TPA: hypothetical protein VD837_11015 [Terriglobales bacterium]|nr:hypothetical protein [Terriglobales bacterium]